MTVVDNFVRKNILTFPTIFPNRTAVLHHALCVIGNGYKWSDRGTVVYSSNRKFSLWNEEKERAEMEADFKVRFEDEEIRAIITEGMDKHIVAAALVVAEIDTRVHQTVPIDSFYPQTHYALLMNIPDNVNKDWANTCEEMKELAEKAGWKF